MKLNMYLLALLGGAVMLGGAPAQAQTGWTQSGVAFDQRSGWCATHTLQEGLPAMEARPCGSEFPYMSVAVAAPAEKAPNLNLAAALAAAANQAEEPADRANVLKLATDKYGACTTVSYSVDRAPISGVVGFAVLAQFTCPAAPGDPRVNYRNFTSLVRQPNGAIWALAFDYPTDPLSAQDIAMLRAAIGHIASAP